ncbi:S24 family peptidase [Stakelama marina]|uniref:Helix-turn-helix transcriptional regulator n=1 Tax=Stakelama marina TaxID=2826939 RepID=A0A8T4IID4_9SPHN|nr:S24 family peptidase [Stakelama marina]MBR0553802.1 helix-turn-helix transcriptional regulator [Stakelama marina]
MEKAVDPRAALDALVHERGESYAALSRMLGRNPAYLQQYVKRGSPRILPERDRAMLARYFGVAEAQLGGPAEAGALVGVPAVDVAATAGRGGLLADDARRHVRRFDAELLRALGLKPAAVSLVRVIGDSMEPTLFDGDEILVNSADRSVGTPGGLYVLRLDDGVMVKRLRRDGDAIVISSDNPAYIEQRAGKGSGIQIIGRVAWLGRVPA